MKHSGRKRRVFLVPFVVTAVMVLWAVRYGAAEGKKDEPYFPRLGNYTDLYLRGSYDLLHMVKVRELGKIGEACRIAALCRMRGGTIFSGIGTPHIMYGGACAEDVPGNPNIAPDRKGPDRGYRGEPPLGKGDFLIVANPSEHVEKAHENGCFVLGIGFPMVTNRYSPPNFNDFPDYFIEDMCDIFIYTWGPKEDGFVTPALTPVPHLKILPSSPMTVAAYWTIMAQIAYNLAYDDTTGSTAAAGKYLDTLMARLDEFHYRFSGVIQEAGEIMAERVLDGGRIHPWSGREEFWIEANGTAGGLMGVYPLNPDSLTSKDIVILAAADATPEKEIETARRVKEKGAWMLGIFPFEREDGISTEPLKELCDISLDNFSGDHYGVLDIPGYPHKIIPTTPMMNNYAFWAVVGAYVQAMERRGVAPYYWMSFHVPGGKEYDMSIRPLFLKRGY